MLWYSVVVLCYGVVRWCRYEVDGAEGWWCEVVLWCCGMVLEGGGGWRCDVWGSAVCGGEMVS